MSGDVLEFAVELLRERGVPHVAAGTERGLGAAIDAGREWLDENAGDVEGLADFAPAASDGLEELRAVAPHVGHLAQSQVEAILARAFRGTLDELDDAEARRAEFASVLSFEERLQAQLAGSLHYLEEALRDEDAWEAVKDTLREVGQNLLKAAIPVLIAVLRGS